MASEWGYSLYERNAPFAMLRGPIYSLGTCSDGSSITLGGRARGLPITYEHLTIT
jgi:hypothetical protein